MTDWKFDLDDVDDEGDDADAGDEDPRFALDKVGDDADDADAAGDPDAVDEDHDVGAGEHDGESGTPHPRDLRPPLEAGDPDLENTAFVLLGAIAMVLVFVRLWLLVG